MIDVPHYFTGQCSSVQLRSMILTNHHLVLFINEGLFISQDLRNLNGNADRGARLYYTRTMTIDRNCDTLEVKYK